MSTMSTTAAPNVRTKMETKPGVVTAFIFFGLMLGGLLFTGYSLMSDVNNVGETATTFLPFYFWVWH